MLVFLKKISFFEVTIKTAGSHATESHRFARGSNKKDDESTL